MPLSINMYSGWEVHRCVNYGFNLFENSKRHMILYHDPYDKGLFKENISPSIAKKRVMSLQLLIMSSHVIFAQVVGKDLVWAKKCKG